MNPQWPSSGSLHNIFGATIGIPSSIIDTDQMDVLDSSESDTSVTSSASTPSSTNASIERDSNTRTCQTYDSTSQSLPPGQLPLPPLPQTGDSFRTYRTRRLSFDSSTPASTPSSASPTSPAPSTIANRETRFVLYRSAPPPVGRPSHDVSLQSSSGRSPASTPSAAPAVRGPLLSIIAAIIAASETLTENPRTANEGVRGRHLITGTYVWPDVPKTSQVRIDTVIAAAEAATSATVPHPPILDEGSMSCSICMADYEVGEEVVALPCHETHRFHEKCIMRAFKEKAKCPHCRRGFAWRLEVA